MNPPKNPTPKPAPASTVEALRKKGDMRSTVLLSLIVCPNGGVDHHRHGQGAHRPAA